MNIALKSDDERFGKYADDGSFAEWPAVDVFGGPYEKHNVIVHRHDTARFFVVPPSREGDIETVTVERSAPVRTIVPPVSEQVAVKRKSDDASS